MSAVIKCSCSHVYQDQKYGTGLRVHNPLVKKSSNDVPLYRCTVCKAVHSEKTGAK